MPLGLKRYQQSRQSHFITFSCYQRIPHLKQTRLRDLFVTCFEQTRRRYGFRVYGYVVMPENVHSAQSLVSGHDFSRAAQAAPTNPASAAEGRPRRA